MKTNSKVVAVFPLGNFEMETSKIALAPELRIRKLLAKERPHRRRRIRLTEFLYGIEIETDEKDALENLPGLVLTTLRLFKSGLVGFGDECFIRNRSSSISDADISSAICPYIYDPLKIHGAPYILYRNEVDSFKTFFNHILSSRPDVSVTIAFRNFNHGMQTFEKESQFLDFVVTLETLYMRDERGWNKKAVLSKRASSLLGRSGREREWIRNKIIDWYKYRSEMLHSGYPSEKSLDKVNLFIDSAALEEIVRRSFRALIALFQECGEKQSLWKRTDMINEGNGPEELQRKIIDYYGCSFPDADKSLETYARVDS